MQGDLEANLIMGGLSPAAAKLISNAIANTATSRLTTGPQLADSTPARSMRQIDADTRKYVLTNLDYPKEDRLRARVQGSATLFQPRTEGHPYQDSQPATSNSTLSTPTVKAGKFVAVSTATANNVAQNEVSLRVTDRNGTHARLNPATGEIEAVPIRIEAQPGGKVEATIEERADATVIKLRLMTVPIRIEVEPENKLEGSVEERLDATVIKIRLKP